MAWEGAGAGSHNVKVAFIQDMHLDIKTEVLGVFLTEHAGTEALGLLWVVHSVCGREANWEWRERPCSRSGSLDPLVALLQEPVMCMHMS